MNWKDEPHLFANGKFEFKDEYGHVRILEAVYNNRLLHTEPPYGFQYHFLNQCTLIGRPIEDMTDEEYRNCPTFKENDITPIDELKYRLGLWVDYRFEDMPAIVQNYLLSIGVYPFSDDSGVEFQPKTKTDYE